MPVKEWQNSGLSQVGYCQDKGLNFSKFNYWVRK
ncbi:IS66 family insertion sequence element accessory protein TnpA [Pedobacter sp. UYP24]